MAIAMACPQGGCPGFLGLIRGGRQPVAVVAGVKVPQRRCPPGAVLSPHAPLPGWASGNDGTRAVAHGNAGNGDPLGNNSAAAAAIYGKVDNVGWENDNCGSNNKDNNKDIDKWGRRALFSLTSSSLS
jgi:hypothetical protein